MKILLLNDGYFLPSLRRQGHEVFFVSPSPPADLVVGLEPVEVQRVLRDCPFQPEALLLTDSLNLRAAFLGLERIPIPKVFYGVDAPMNAFWQTDFCLAFDLAFLDQKASVEQIWKRHSAARERVHWLPLAADHHLYQKQSVEKCYDLTFVGSLNDRLRPKRSWILKALQKSFKVAVFDGQNRRSLPPSEVVKIYHQSKVVVNENLFPGINLRTFEVISSGACLLTEEGEGSWKELFTDWRHLVTFTSENLLERSALLLENEILREQIARNGMTLVRGQHTIDVRTSSLIHHLTQWIRHRGQEKRSFPCYHLGAACLALAHRWPGQPVGALSKEGVRLLRAAAASKSETADLHFEFAAQALGESLCQQALGSLQRVQELDPAHLRSIWALFWCYRQLQDHRRAALELGRLCQYLRRKPTDPGLWDRVSSGAELSAEDFLVLGEILAQAGFNLEAGIDRSLGHPCRWNALEAFQKALALDPANAQAFLRCADLLERADCSEFALPFLEKAVGLEPLNPDWRWRLAELLLRNYRREEGLKQLVHYLSMTPEVDNKEKIEELHLSESECNWLGEARLQSRQSAKEKPVRKGRPPLQPNNRTRLEGRTDAAV